MLETLAAQSIAQRGTFPVGTQRLDKHNRRGCKEAIFKIGFWLGPIDTSRYGFKRQQDCVRLRSQGVGVFSSLMPRNALNLHQRVTRGVSKPDEEPAVTDDAVANFAEAGEIYEQALLTE